MTVSILHATTRTAFAAATTQLGQCEAVRDAFAGNVTVRIEGAGGVHLRTLTLGPFTINSNTTRGLVCGAVLADTAVSPITPGAAGIAPTRWEFRDGSTPIFDTDEITQGPIRALCRPTFGGVVFTAQAGLPSGSPLDPVLDLIAAQPPESWVQLNAGRNTIQDAFPPPDLVPLFGGAPGPPERVQGAWPCIACTPSGLDIWGGGHANTSFNAPFGWLFSTRDWRLTYHCSEMQQMDATPRFLAVDDAAPVSSHVYGNTVWLSQLQRLLTFGGAEHGDGGPLKVWIGGVIARAAGAWTLDLSQGGQGMVAGTTGSNPKRGAFVGVDLPGANAWTRRDWFGQSTSHPSRPRAGGVDYDQHLNCGATATVEGGKDVVYYTAGSSTARHLWRVELDANPLNDVQTYIAAQGVDNSAQGQGPISLDPVRRIVIKLTVSNQGAGGTVHFVDLKRIWGATNAWRAATLTGPDVAEFVAMVPDLGNAGVTHNPIKGCFVVFNMGRQVWEIYPPNSAAYVDNSGTNLTADTGWALVKPAMHTGTPAPRDNYIVDPLLGETGILGKWQWHPAINCGITTFGNRAGEVWAYKSTGWTDPRT